MKLTENGLKNFKAAAYFSDNSDRINHLDFSVDGEALITSSHDESIRIYDCQTGTPKVLKYSSKYGVDLICFTHVNDHALHSSTKVNDSVRLLAITHNNYIHYFQGHTKTVTSLAMSPLDDCGFLSASEDETMRLWDTRTNMCQGILTVPGKPVAGFDPAGLVFAVGTQNEQKSFVKLFDIRSYDHGPFSTFFLPTDKESRWKDLKFSRDGNHILLSGTTQHQLIDAFDGRPVHSLKGFQNEGEHRIEASFTPDSQFIISGSSDGKIHGWSVDTGQEVAHLPSEHQHPLQCLQFSPHYMMMASAGHKLALWLPETEEEGS